MRSAGCDGGGADYGGFPGTGSGGRSGRAAGDVLLTRTARDIRLHAQAEALGRRRQRADERTAAVTAARARVCPATASPRRYGTEEMLMRCQWSAGRFTLILPHDAGRPAGNRARVSLPEVSRSTRGRRLYVVARETSGRGAQVAAVALLIGYTVTCGTGGAAPADLSVPAVAAPGIGSSILTVIPWSPCYHVYRQLAVSRGRRAFHWRTSFRSVG